MAYALRYYKEIPQKNGGAFRLEIHKKDSSVGAIEIGGVIQGLSLQIQGQQGDIDTPIVKTSLSMTFADASDLQNGKKNGFWEEFYTPDAVLWKVILKAKDAKETAFRTIWGGYVTPDSFSETLSYRGSVNIIARDNIGHMQDFPFDAEGDADGLISLYNLVESGWEKIQSPMMLEWRGNADSTMWLECDGVSAMFTLMNVSMFEGMDWYKAIETALASYGVVMRYVGNNIVKMSSLRSMPYQGEEFIEDITHIEPRFITGAQRELVPAVKRIEESIDYELENISVPLVKTSDFSGEIVLLGTAPYTAPAWVLKNTASGQGWSNPIPSKSLFFNPSAYMVEEVPYLPAFEETKDAVYNTMYLLCGPEGHAEYSRRVNPADTTVKMRFGKPVFLVYDDTLGSALYNRLLEVDYRIQISYNGITQYLQENGEWGTAVHNFQVKDTESGLAEVSQFIPLSQLDGPAVLHVIITRLSVDGGMLEEMYVALHGLDFTIGESTPCLEKNTVNTIYNADNNVILSRDPEIGPAYNIVALPGFIKNGIFYRSGDAILPARKWSWGSGSEQQMAVWNHLQLLSYYAKPNNLISGTIVNADITRAKAIYMWHGAEHILVSGTYNFLNGHIESAVLREFARYEDMWSEVAGADLPDTEQDSRSNVEGGASGGGASSTYSSTTNVNIGTGGGGGTGASNLNDLNDVDTSGVVAQSVLYYNGTAWVDMSLPSLLSGYAKKGTTLADYGITNAYTKSEVDAKGYATTGYVDTKVGSIDLSPYAKSKDVADTYATKKSLEAYTLKTAYDAFVASTNSALSNRYTKGEIDTKVTDINTAIGKKANASDVYTTTQIDAKVQTINEALANRYTKAQVDGIVTTINNSISAVDSKYAPTKTWADTLASLIVNENGNVRIKTNLIINGDTASGGGSGSASVGISGIKLNGTTYRDENSDGIIDLGTITSGLTSVSWTDVQGRPTALSQFTNDLGLAKVATSGKYSDLDGLPTIPTTMAWTAITGKPTFASVATSGDYKDLVNKPTIPVVPSSLKNPYALTFGSKTYDGSVAQTITASDLGALTEHQSLAGYATQSWIEGKGYAVASGLGTLAYKNGLTASDVGALSTSGGTLSGAVTMDGTIARLKMNGGIIEFNDASGNFEAYLRVYQSNLSVYDGASWRKIYHTGNFNPANYLPLTGGTMAGNIVLPTGYNLRDSEANTLLGTDGSSNFKLGATSWALVLRSNGTATINGKTIYHAGNFNPADYLPLSGGTISGQLNVTNINGYAPITSGNIASQSVSYAASAGSATKLATARTIWGQSFDGSGDIGGHLTLANEIKLRCKNSSGTSLDILRLGSNNSLTIGYDMAGVGDTYITGNSVYLRYGGNRTVGLKLNSSGNVGIGTTSPAYKLDVNGDTRINGTLTAGATTINGDLRVNGNVIVTGDTASGGSAGATSGGGTVFTTTQDIPTGTSIAQSRLDTIGLTDAVITDMLNGKYQHLIINVNNYKTLYTITGYVSSSARRITFQCGGQMTGTGDYYDLYQSNGGTWRIEYGEL